LKHKGAGSGYKRHEDLGELAGTGKLSSMGGQTGF